MQWQKTLLKATCGDLICQIRITGIECEVPKFQHEMLSDFEMARIEELGRAITAARHIMHHSYSLMHFINPAGEHVNNLVCGFVTHEKMWEVVLPITPNVKFLAGLSLAKLRDGEPLASVRIETHAQVLPFPMIFLGEPVSR